MKTSTLIPKHFENVFFRGVWKGFYSPMTVKAAEAIAAARIWRNIGYKAAASYASKRAVDMRLVRLASQLEAARKAGV
jgi:hypothetical protein